MKICHVESRCERQRIHDQFVNVKYTPTHWLCTNHVRPRLVLAASLVVYLARTSAVYLPEFPRLSLFGPNSSMDTTPASGFVVPGSNPTQVSAFVVYIVLLYVLFYVVLCEVTNILMNQSYAAPHRWMN